MPPHYTHHTSPTPPTSTALPLLPHRARARCLSPRTHNTCLALHAHLRHCFTRCALPSLPPRTYRTCTPPPRASAALTPLRRCRLRCSPHLFYTVARTRDARCGTPRAPHARAMRFATLRLLQCCTTLALAPLQQNTFRGRRCTSRIRISRRRASHIVYTWRLLAAIRDCMT